jgi:hypothetical protein
LRSHLHSLLHSRSAAVSAAIVAAIAVTCIGDIPQWVERSVWVVALLMATQ